MAIFKITYASKCLGRYKDLNVILPVEESMMVDPLLQPVHKAGEKKLFKTLYLLHGYSGNQDDWMTGTRIRELADIYGIAVVFPSGENSFYVDGDSVNTRYGEMIGKEIVEFTRSVFPLSDKREDTYIGGLSMGGYGALRVGSYYHETFSKIVCFSSAFVVDDVVGMKKGDIGNVGDYEYYCHTFGNLDEIPDSPKDPFWCVERAVKTGNMPQLYMTCGSEDILIEKNRAAVKRFRDLGLDLHYHESPGIHNWDFWGREIEPAIKWLLEREEG
jgi:S-formylglutathione hydrolase FrmB